MTRAPARPDRPPGARRRAAAGACVAGAAAVGLAVFAVGASSSLDDSVQRQHGQPGDHASIHHLPARAEPQEVASLEGVGRLAVACSAGSATIRFLADRMLPTATLVLREVGGRESLARTLHPGQHADLRIPLEGGGAIVAVFVMPFSKGPTHLTTAAITLRRSAGSSYQCDVGVRGDVAPVRAS